jgi:ferric-chelate reductase
MVRKSFFGLFEICHWIGMVSLLAGMAWHVKMAVPWVISTMVIYFIAIIFSLTKTRIAHATLMPLAGADTTLISIPQLKSGWRAGQHVRIRIPALGLRHGFEGHPFTIATAPDGEGLVLMCKVAGDWTRKLYGLAIDGTQQEMAGKWGTKTTVIVEGPYGELSSI